MSRSTHDRDAAKIIPTRFSGIVEEKVEKRAVNLGQGGKIRELDPLVNLVHGQSDEAKFGDWTVGPDKACVGGAAGGAELGRPSGDLPDRFGKAVAKHTRRI